MALIHMHDMFIFIETIDLKDCMGVMHGSFVIYWGKSITRNVYLCECMYIRIDEEHCMICELLSIHVKFCMCYGLFHL